MSAKKSVRRGRSASSSFSAKAKARGVARQRPAGARAKTPTRDRGEMATRSAAPARGSKPNLRKETEFVSRNELRLEAGNKVSGSDSPRRHSNSGIRLQKALADAGVAARRDCEQLVLSGRIQVNGITVTELPCFVDPERDVVARDGVPLDLSASIVRKRNEVGAPEFTYLLINKPKGMITTARDPEGRPTVLQMVPHAIRARERLFPVGRLDADSIGLLLLTNDGDLAYQLTHPKFGVIKEYRVTTTGLAGDEQLEQLKRGVYLLNPGGDGQTRAKRTNLESVRVLKRFVDRSRGDRTVLSIKLREGQNREIRRLLARVGLKVRDLERVAIGPLRAIELQPGQCKLLGKRDVDRLRASVLSTE
ncbi:MAG: pseudouridine synthase [Steroidobacteraceae bacterium]